MKNAILNEVQEGIVHDYFDLRIDTFFNALLNASQDINAQKACQRVVSTIGALIVKNSFMNIVNMHYTLESHRYIRESLGNIHDLLHEKIDAKHPLMISVCDPRLNSHVDPLNPEKVKKEISQILKGSVAEWLQAKENAHAFPAANIFSGLYRDNRDNICR